MAPDSNTQTTATRRTNADLWFYTLCVGSGFVLLVNIIAVAARVRPAAVRVPVRLIPGSGFVQGDWWSPYIALAILAGFFAIGLVYATKLKRLNPIYRNGVMVSVFVVQLLGVVVLYRIAGLSSLV